MKFSWNILNNFINLELINFQKFIEQITLAGFEIETIEENKKINDKIINLSITANRKEIYCVFNLAQEMSSILNEPLKISIQSYHQNNQYKIKSNVTKFKFIEYIKINTIHNIQNKESPVWLQNNLEAYEIQPINLLHDIEKYIELKWGHSVQIIDLHNLKIQLIDNKFIIVNKSNRTQNTEQILYNNEEIINITNKNIENKFATKTSKTKNIIICHIIYKQNNIDNSQYTFNNANEDTIKLITTFGKGVINKSYHHNIFNIENKKLRIGARKIKYILGPITQYKLKFLSNKDILKTLKQLKLEPQFLKEKKIFNTVIPKYRQHDLQRDIDIIEEIGRIYGFKKFVDDIPKYENKGKMSLKKIYLKKVSNILIDIGLDEVMNSSLTKNFKNQETIKIYNEITEEQKILRINILDNLIKNYNHYSVNEKKLKTEIFEIGKIFYKNNLIEYIEEKHLGILIKNDHYFKKNWSNKPENLEWFHAKGIIETLLKKLNIKNIIWSNEINNNLNESLITVLKYIKRDKKLFIYKKKSKHIIGVLGELKKIYNNTREKQNKKLYVCEINLKDLMMSVYFEKHLNYHIKPYSLYPSVHRDISINTKQSINSIKNIILKNNINLIESIQTINEYYNKKDNSKSICLRFTYRSINKTLNKQDITNINKHIENVLLQLNSTIE
uniref:phenylalanine--tRNA ligase n=1 Tax=Dasya naccarioides TaxID=2007180 RepID=A0A1Z1MHP7_9FLOR|nr:Phenylalanine-tRNA ligase beta subunit [Dasya naccarioides]ARW65271.1 Phenylalanine-tRNA ligase beta subunit [Dasya naccarioides]